MLFDPALIIPTHTDSASFSVNNEVSWCLALKQAKLFGYDQSHWAVYCDILLDTGIV